MDQRIARPRDYVAEDRRRRLLLLSGAAILVLAMVAYFMPRDDGEDNRAAYCEKLEQLAAQGSRLEVALANADNTEVDAITSLAPSSVHPAWVGLSETFTPEHHSSQQQHINEAKLEPELGKVVEDAQDKCGLTINP